MAFIEPSKIGYTIYSKLDCPQCFKIKILLEEEPDVTTLDCDLYLLNNRDGFLEFMNNIAGKECKIFPMVFYEGVFVGGFKETWKHYQELKAFE